MDLLKNYASMFGYEEKKKKMNLFFVETMQTEEIFQSDDYHADNS